MTERQRPSGPKEGIYLDAALAAVGERVDEQIDRIAARRRRRSRALVASLAATTLLGGAVTAAALTFAPEPPAAPVYELHSVRCVEGADDAAGAFYAVRFEIDAALQDRVNPEALCRAAWDRLAAAPRLVDAGPAQLLALGRELIRATSTPSAEEPKLPLEVTPRSSTFGALRDPAALPPVRSVCGNADADTVLFAESGTAACTSGAPE